VIPPWINIEPGEYKDVAHILPLFENLTNCEQEWALSMLNSENAYLHLLDGGPIEHWQEKKGWTPQQARSVLPNSLKTEIVMTANLREWRHVLKLRTSKAAHPQMQEIMIPLLAEFKKLIPVVFDDIGGNVGYLWNGHEWVNDIKEE
jgi:thymidylate synthase ThyX